MSTLKYKKISFSLKILLYGVRLKAIMWIKEVISMAKDEKIRKVFADNLKGFFIQKGVTQKELAKYMGVSAPTVNDWLKGRVLPRMDKIDKLCVYFNVMRSDFLEAPANDTPPPNAIPMNTYTYKIPLLGRVAAGEPIYADEHIESYEYIDSRYKDDGNEYFALRIDGQSMEPTIMDGDIVIVRQQSFAENGQIAIVLIDGEDATAKEVRESAEGITLIGHNVAVYTPHFYSHKQIEELPVKIIGVVTEIRRRLIV